MSLSLKSSSLKNLATCINIVCLRSGTSSFTLSIYVLPLRREDFLGILEFSQKLGYAIANNLHINFGKAVLIQILHVMGPIGFRKHSNSKC